MYLRVHLIACVKSSLTEVPVPGWAGQSVGLHVFILAQTNFPYLCLCSLDTGHSA